MRHPELEVLIVTNLVHVEVIGSDVAVVATRALFSLDDTRTAHQNDRHKEERGAILLQAFHLGVQLHQVGTAALVIAQRLRARQSHGDLSGIGVVSVGNAFVLEIGRLLVLERRGDLLIAQILLQVFLSLISWIFLLFNDFVVL